MSRAIQPAKTSTTALSANAQRLIRSSKARNTKRAYSSALSGFNDYLDKRGLPHWPTDPGTLIEYLEYLAEEHRPSSIQVKLAGLRYAYRLQGLADPTAHELVKTVMAGIR